MKRQEYTLENGLRVVTIDTKSYPTFTCALLVRAGSRDESAQNNGVAHFFEHMVFKGSKKYPTPSLISTILDGLGGDHNAFTAQDHTGYWIRGANEHFQLCIDVLSDMIKHPNIDPVEMEKEKGAIIEEINMYEDNPMWRASEFLDEVMYKGTSLGLPIAGSKETVMAMKPDDIRSYLGAWYKPKNAILVVAGGLESIESTMKNTIAQAFEDWTGGGDVPSRVKYKGIHTTSRIQVMKRASEQMHIRIGYPAYSYSDPRRFALSILTTVLGGGMSSRLFSQVREKHGLCYYISMGAQAYEDAGHVVTSLGTSVEPEKVKLAIQLSLKEHEQITMQPISPQELARAKSMVKGHFLLSLESSEYVAEHVAKQSLFYSESLTPEQICEHIDSVTATQVQSVAQDILKPSAMYLCAVGPITKSELASYIG